MADYETDMRNALDFADRLRRRRDTRFALLVGGTLIGLFVLANVALALYCRFS